MSELICYGKITSKFKVHCDRYYKSHLQSCLNLLRQFINKNTKVDTKKSQYGDFKTN